jgi:predicted lipoprotein with Yx(FWY)xxD motif
MRRRLLLAFLVLTLVAAGCGGDDDDAGVSTGTDAGDEADDADLTLADSDFGDILVDADGNTVYLFTPDAQGASTCNGQCAANWPPLAEVTTVGDGLDDDLLGTTTRSDGKAQATYNGWPLYRFAADRAPGDTNGQGVNGSWFVVDADGDKVERKAGTSGTPSYGY